MTFVDECTVFAQGRPRRQRIGVACTRSRTSRAVVPTAANGGRRRVDRVRGLAGRARPVLARRPPAPARPTGGEPGRSAKRDGATGQGPGGPGARRHRGLRRAGSGRRPGRGGARGVVARGRPGRPGQRRRFASARNRVPRTAEPGEDGEDKRLRGRAAHGGRRRVSWGCRTRASPRCWLGSPPRSPRSRTTRSPRSRRTWASPGGDGDRFVVADIPGLVEGASEGKGLGHRFLRHIVRCRALVLVVDLAADDPAADLATLRAELVGLRPRARGCARRSWWARRRTWWTTPRPTAAAARGRGARGLGDDGRGARRAAGAARACSRSEAEAAEPERRRTWCCVRGRPRFTVVRERDGRWRVQGRNVERWVLRPTSTTRATSAKLQARLEKEGVERKLAVAGRSARRRGGDPRPGVRVSSRRRGPPERRAAARDAE